MWLCPEGAGGGACPPGLGVQSNRGRRGGSSARLAVGLQREAAQAKKDRAALPSWGDGQALPSAPGKRAWTSCVGAAWHGTRQDGRAH